jgi:hypothetical protein
VLHGGDQAKQVLEWSEINGSIPSGSFAPAVGAIGRLCSPDLALPSAFYNRGSGKGYTGRIFVNGEEVGSEGRAFAHLIRNPHAGGRYDMLLDGKGPQQMLDNMTVDGDGNLILQEDPGNQEYLARIWKFYPRERELVEIAKHDPARFWQPQPQNHHSADAAIQQRRGILRRN